MTVREKDIQSYSFYIFLSVFPIKYLCITRVDIRLTACIP
jgi:hypothetical protein